jgi:hypothetical protein
MTTSKLYSRFLMLTDHARSECQQCSPVSPRLLVQQTGFVPIAGSPKDRMFLESHREFSGSLPISSPGGSAGESAEFSYTQVHEDAGHDYLKPRLDLPGRVLIVNDSVTWAEAAALCQARGAELFVPNADSDFTMDDFNQLSLGLSEALRWWGHQNWRGTHDFSAVWLGATRNLNTSSPDRWLKPIPAGNATSPSGDGPGAPGFAILSEGGSEGGPWLTHKDGTNGDCVSMVLWSNMQPMGWGVWLRQDDCPNKYAYACSSVPAGY